MGHAGCRRVQATRGFESANNVPLRLSIPWRRVRCDPARQCCLATTLPGLSWEPDSAVDPQGRPLAKTCLITMSQPVFAFFDVVSVVATGY